MADFENLVEIEKRLPRLEGDADGQFPRSTLVRCFRNPWKHSAGFLADRLAIWLKLKAGPSSHERKALSPDLMVRSLHASTAPLSSQ